MDAPTCSFVPWYRSKFQESAGKCPRHVPVFAIRLPDQALGVASSRPDRKHRTAVSLSTQFNCTILCPTARHSTGRYALSIRATLVRA